MPGPAVTPARIRRVSPTGLTRLVRSLAIGAALAILLVGCGSSAASPSVGQRPAGNGSAAPIVAALTQGGLTCVPVVPRTVATYVADAVSCAIDGKDVVIRTFADGADRDRFISASAGVVDQMSLEIDAPPRVVGPTWIITAEDGAIASRVQRVLGGEIR